MLSRFLFCLIVGIGGGFLILLDMLSSQREPNEAIKTREAWLLYGANIIIAALLSYSLVDMKKVDLGFLSAIAIILGYPLLVHTKLFSIKSSLGQDTSVGFEWIYEQVRNILIPSIEKSVLEISAQYMERFRSMPMDHIIARARNYVAPINKMPPETQQTKEEVLEWLDKTLSDTKARPENEDKAKEIIFAKIREIGGLRGIRYCMRAFPNSPTGPPTVTTVSIASALKTTPDHSSLAAIDAQHKPVMLAVGTVVHFSPDPHTGQETTPDWAHINLGASPIHGWYLRASLQTTGG